jgi:hypothetical protein
LFPAAALATPVPPRPQVPQLPQQFPAMPAPAGPRPYAPVVSAPDPVLSYQPPSQPLPQPPVQSAPHPAPAPAPFPQTPFPQTPAFSPSASEHDLASFFPAPASAPYAPAASVTADSALRPLPPAAESISVPPRRATSGTPLMMKITAAAGIVAALCGIALMVYFFVFDRAKDQRPVVAQTTPPVDPTPASPPPAQPDAGSETTGISIDFPPMEIERSAKSERLVRRAAKPKRAAAPVQKPLTEEQKRLMALYNKGGGPAAPTPTPAAPERRVVKAERQLSENEVRAMQRKHKPELTACYERALKRDESLSELNVYVTITIAENGTVKGVQLDGTSDIELGKCIKRTVRAWVFAPVGAEQDYKIPMVFRGS